MKKHSGGSGLLIFESLIITAFKFFKTSPKSGHLGFQGTALAILQIELEAPCALSNGFHGAWDSEHKFS